jgi:hypothetical protein
LDPDGKARKAFGLGKEDKVFLIGKDGKVEKIVDPDEVETLIAEAVKIQHDEKFTYKDFVY